MNPWLHISGFMKYKLKNAALFSPTKAATGLGKVFRSTYQDASSTISLFSEAAIAVCNLHRFKAFTWQCFCVSPGLLGPSIPCTSPAAGPEAQTSSHQLGVHQGNAGCALLGCDNKAEISRGFAPPARQTSAFPST